MVEQIDLTRRRLIKGIPLIIGAALAPGLLLPQRANAIVSTEYEKNPKYPSEDYVKYLANETQYPSLCNLHFKIPKNKLVSILGKTHGEITGYFDISMTPELARIEVDFHHPEESQLIRLMEEKVGDRMIYSEYIDQRIPYRGAMTRQKEFDAKTTDIWRLNIPRVVREALNGRANGTGIIYNGKEKEQKSDDKGKEQESGDNGREIHDPGQYGLFIEKSSSPEYPLILFGDIKTGGSKLNNIKVYCKTVNNKIIPIELSGDYSLGGFLSDSIELRGILQEAA